MPTCFTDMEVERIGRRRILFIDFERREGRLDEQLLSGRVGLIYKELVGKAGLSLVADGCRVRGTLAKPGFISVRKPESQLLRMGVWEYGLLANILV